MIFQQVYTPTNSRFPKQRKGTGKRIISGTAHHMPLKLFFALHETEAELTKVQLQTVIVFRWEGGEVPCLNLISSKFNSSYIFHFGKFLMFSQTSSIKLLMALKCNNRYIKG